MPFQPINMAQSELTFHGRQSENQSKFDNCDVLMVQHNPGKLDRNVPSAPLQPG